MTVVLLHPEELIDKSVRGTLSETERARLDEHLAQCVTCRFEMALRAELADELDGAEQDDGHEETPLLTLAPILHASAPANETSAESPEAPLPPPPLEVASTPRRPRSRRTPWLIAAAALLFVGVAGAGQGIAGDWMRRHVGDRTSEREPHDAVAAPSSNVVASGTPEAPTAIVEEAPAPVAPIATEAESPIAVPVRLSSQVSSGAAQLFDEASAARRRGDYVRALEVHRQLQQRFPASREAHVSQATMGRLLLDRGDPVGALESFDAYLARGHGDLDESVMASRATALDRLGRTEQASRAWQALLDAHPSTPYGEHARARVAQASPQK